MTNTILTALATALLGGCLAQAQTGRGDLAGTWQTDLTIKNCDTGAAIATFPEIKVFSPGGAYIGTTAGRSPALVSTTLGTWWRTGRYTFTSTAMLLRFDATGAYIGAQRFTRSITMSGPDEFTSENKTEVLDIAAKVVGQGCSTETGRRMD